MITVSTRNGDTVTVEGGLRNHGISIGYEGDFTFITVTELVEMVRNNAKWRIEIKTD